jgi:hypothetical protein
VKPAAAARSSTSVSDHGLISKRWSARASCEEIVSSTITMSPTKRPSLRKNTPSADRVTTGSRA